MLHVNDMKGILVELGAFWTCAALWPENNLDWLKIQQEVKTKKRRYPPSSSPPLLLQFLLINFNRGHLMLYPHALFYLNWTCSPPFCLRDLQAISNSVYMHVWDDGLLSRGKQIPRKTPFFSFSLSLSPKHSKMDDRVLAHCLRKNNNNVLQGNSCGQQEGSEMWVLARNEVIPGWEGKLQVERPPLLLYTSEPAVPNHPGYSRGASKCDCERGAGERVRNNLIMQLNQKWNLACGCTANSRR